MAKMLSKIATETGGLLVGKPSGVPSVPRGLPPSHFQLLQHLIYNGVVFPLSLSCLCITSNDNYNVPCMSVAATLYPSGSSHQTRFVHVQ